MGKKCPDLVFAVAVAVAAVLVSSCGGPLKTDYEIAKERAHGYVARHPRLDDKTRDTILRNMVRVGMTKDEVLAAWGRPVEVNRFKREEEWLFPCVYPHHCTDIDRHGRFGPNLFDRIRYESQVIFEKGRVTSFRY